MTSYRALPPTAWAHQPIAKTFDESRRSRLATAAGALQPQDDATRRRTFLERMRSQGDSTRHPAESLAEMVLRVETEII